EGSKRGTGFGVVQPAVQIEHVFTREQVARQDPPDLLRRSRLRRSVLRRSGLIAEKRRQQEDRKQGGEKAAENHFPSIPRERRRVQDGIAPVGHAPPGLGKAFTALNLSTRTES